jgi:hypothetical protein
MSPAQQSRNQRRPRQAAQGAVPDFWHAAAALPELQPIAPTRDPTALMRSLGDLPNMDRAEARYHVAAVIERAVPIATALAHTAGLLADPNPG